jgi:signal transduction histidine kinase
MNQNFFKQWLVDLPIGRKGLLLMLPPLCLHLIFILIFWFVYVSMEAGRNWSGHSREVLTAVEELRAVVNAAYYNSVLAVVVKDIDVEKDQDKNLKLSHEGISRLSGLVSDNAVQSEGVREMDRALSDFSVIISELESVVKTSASQNNSEKADAVRSLIKRSIAAKDTFDAVLMKFRNSETKRSTKRWDQVERGLHRAGWIVVGGYVALVCFSCVFYVLFRESIESRLRGVADNLTRISEGESITRSMAGQDEIGKVDNAIHSLAAALSERAMETEVFLYSVSHDLRSPLVNLSGFTDELRYSIGEVREKLGQLPDPGPEVRQAIDLLDVDCEKSFTFIRSAVSRLSRIIEALLRLSRAGRVQYQNDKIDLQNIAQRVVDTLSNSISAAGARVKVEQLPEVYGDESAYENVFANLLANAVAYLDKSRPGLIEIGQSELDSAASKAVIYVRDNGVGISEGSQKKLFLAFQRFRPELGAGEGIGLALIRRVLSRMGSRIWCESTEGVGTTFYFDVSLTPEHRLDIPAASIEL